MAGNYKFNKPGQPNASIVNLGNIHITPSSTGFAALVAPGVRNAGTITANLGHVALASGNGFTLDFYGDKLITLQVNDLVAAKVLDVATGQPLKSLVSNEGKLRANGGQVELTAAAARHVVDSVINNTGTIEANSVGTKNGMIVLGAATAGTKPAGEAVQKVKIAGKLSASGHKAGQTGGTITVTGEDIALTGAKINAKGQAGGGKVLIGDKTASTVAIDSASTINASATQKGDGGKVVVLSNGLTSIAGLIRASGGPLGGNGGFVETSGQTVDFTGIRVNTSAPAGTTGMWLVDPTNLTINSDNVETLTANLATTSVTLQTNGDGTTSGPGFPSAGAGDIVVDSSIYWSGKTSLTLSAFNDVAINQNITNSGGGGVTLRADNAGRGTGTVRFGDGESSPMVSTTGPVSIFYNPGSYTGPNSSSVPNSSGLSGNPYSNNVTGPLTAYMLVNTATDLQNVGTNLNGIYALGRDIDASTLTNFKPIGSFAGPGFAQFNGIFDGQFVKGSGPAISNLTIAPTQDGLNHLGLFAFNAGTIRDLHLSNVSVTANPHGSDGQQIKFQAIGTVAGENGGLIKNVTVDGTSSVNGGTLSGVTAGGLVGQNTGVFVNSFGDGDQTVHTFVPAKIKTSSADVAVTIGDGVACKSQDCNGGQNYAGGLAGINGGTIKHSSASGDVMSGANSYAGGLVGAQQSFTQDSSPPRVSSSFATGNVSSAGMGVALGGLVGRNQDSAVIWKSRASGNVTASADGSVQFNSNFAGGLVGQNSGMILGHSLPWPDQTCGAGFACASGAVSVGAGASAGGLVGANTGTLRWVFATGDVTGAAGAGGSAQTTVLGGLVGQNDSMVSHAFATGSVGGVGVGHLAVGGLVGVNSGTVRRSSANAAVSAGDFSNVGGLVGFNTGTVAHARAKGDVVAGSDSAAGGLVGDNLGTVWRSRASGAVTAGDFSNAGGLVGSNFGTVGHSRANGDVVVGSNSAAGGLVGNNQMFSADHDTKARIFGSHADGNVSSDGSDVLLGGLVGRNGDGGRIRDSYATGDVTSSGMNAGLGGLVGSNDTGGRIKDSHATGDVTSTGNIANSDCSTAMNCQFVLAGGLVGQNQGKITSTLGLSGGGTELGLTFATGNVSVGQNGTAGGLVGFNDGIIRRSVATGNVTGASGSGNNEHDRTTTIGGLVGENQGVISGSFAVGTVGSADARFITAGGFVGENSGTIRNSAAFGDVLAGANSVAGGFVGNNATNDGSCGGCTHGIGFNQNAMIKTALAFGAVTVGSSGLAGGFSGSGNGHFSFVGAFGPVTGGDNSVLGGLVGALSLKKNDAGETFAGSIDNSVAFGPVTSTGANSVIGGLVGINGGDISLSAFGPLGGPASGPGSPPSGPGNNLSDSFVSSQFASFASGPLPGQVAGTSDSFIGGLVGINIGTIRDGLVGDGASVTGSGGNNFVGGLAALNFGSINTSVSRATVSSGDNSVVGNAVGANATFVNFQPGQIPNSSFPSGTMDPSTTGITGTATPQVGVTNPQGGLPTFPAIIPPCGDAVCFVLNNGRLTDPLPPLPPLPPILPPDIPNVPPLPLIKLLIPPTPPIQQIVPINFNTGSQQPVQINLTTGDTGGTGGTRGTGGNGANGGNGNNAGNKPPGNPPGVPPPGRGIGRTLNEQMFSGVPPLGETRFLPEIVLQISNTISLDRVLAAAKKLGLTLIGSQSFDAAGRVIYRFGTGGKDIRALIAALEHNQIVASAQPNYIFGLAQGATPPAAPAQTDQTGSIPPAGEATDLANSDTASLTSLPAGDAAQYVIDKLHLGALHQRVRGRNVTVAVIDSEIDAKHPDLAGVIAERFDATSSESRPHLHGTGMAGAIASHQRLLGVAPGVRILAIKAFDESASSAEATSFQILKGLDYAISRNVRIINMSFAGPRDLMMERTLKTAYDKGIVLIAAAGNAGPKSAPLYPGADPSVIAVTATDYADKPFAMANRGNYIAVAAPGVDVMVPSPNGSYQLTTGTSVAAAHVSGIAALLLESKPTMTPSELRAVLMRTAKAITARQKDDPTVAGLVDPVGALQAMGPARAVETVPPAGPALH
ncbi:MAG TPA: S8 family serine peptidase [Xanthobacteraceae bacterium]|nr:S8 family serine peptidase [Xanthobacteraceae bacterium]